VTGVILKPCIWPDPSTEPFADAPATAGANIKWDGNGPERLKLTSTDTYDSRRLEWFADEEPTQNYHSVGGNDFLLILKTRYTDEGDLVGTAVDDVASWSGSASRTDDASADYEANRWGEHFEMIRDANGEWAVVVYEATDPRRATFSRAASQSSVFNPVTGEFDGSSSVSGDSEVTVTGHEINEVPAEKNRFELNLETIFVDANSSHTPPDDEEDASSEYDDTDYPVNTDPPGSVWGAAASGFVSGFFSWKNASTAIGLIPVVGTIQSAVELATGYDFIAGEEADRRLAAVGLVPGGKGVANGAKGIINAAAPAIRQTGILGTAAGAANALRKNAPVKGLSSSANIAISQLEKKWKHAVDFGITTTKRNASTLADFQRAIVSHLDDAATVAKGTYQYVAGSKVFFNPNTNLVVILDSAGNFVSGWKLVPGTPQFLNFINNGILR